MAASSKEEQAAEYGWSYAVLSSVPELSRLFDAAVKQQYTGARFVAELRDTKWYKSHGEAYRQSIVLQKADPAEWNRRRQAMRSQISDQYYALTGRRAGGTTLWKFADQALMYGYGEGEIRDLAGRMVRGQNLMTHGGLGGQLGEVERQLRQASEDYGLGFSDTAIARQVNAVAQQTQDLTSTIAYYRKAAASKYAGFADEIKAGMTVKDIAEPFKQLMAKTLEISDKGISVNDALIQKALTHRQMNGKKLGPPAGMALHEFEKTLKNDPRWMKTNNARDSMMNVGMQVLRDFGFEGAAG